MPCPAAYFGPYRDFGFIFPEGSKSLGDLKMENFENRQCLNRSNPDAGLMKKFCPTKDAGRSLLEILVVLGILLTVAGIGIPILWGALQTVRSLMSLVSQVVVR
jgi:hypothetical protein